MPPSVPSCPGGLGSSERFRRKILSQPWDLKLEHVILKTLCGFMNAEGGELIIGVDDAGVVLGLEVDYATLQKQNRDGFELFLGDLCKTGLSGPAHTLARVAFEEIDGREVCHVSVAASARPVFSKSLEGKVESEFWVRVGNSTRQLVGSEMVQYQKDHWE